MKNITQTIKSQYYRYNPGEFLPVYSGGELLNKTDFHKYKLANFKQTIYWLTHQAG